MIGKLRANWKSGLTVSLVSIPLAISLAVASQVSPVQGIITATWAGLIASIFGGSNYNIIGPTGALSGIIATYVLTHGIHLVSMLAILSGLIILVAYMVRLERYLIFIPSSVIHGFTLGIACIIALQQLNALLGLQGLKQHRDLIKNVWESLTHIQQTSFSTLFISLTFFIGLYIIRRKLRRIPGPIVACPLGIALGYLSTNNFLPLSLETLGNKFGAIQPALAKLPAFSFSLALISPALVIALIAILETMLSARIADGMTKTRHNSRNELFGLGLANIGSGLMGGIPATAALARTALNIKTGATDKISATISSIGIALGSFALLSYFNYMPMAVIAAILLNVALNMIEMEHFYRLWWHDKNNFFISLLVAALTVYKDPMLGIFAGAAISLILFVQQLAYSDKKSEEVVGSWETLSEQQIIQEAKQLNTQLYSFGGKLAYINSQTHIKRFIVNSTPHTNVIIQLSRLYFIDLDGVDAFDEIIELLQKREHQIYITNANSHIRAFLHATSKKFIELEQRGAVFNTTSDAILRIQSSRNA